MKKMILAFFLSFSVLIGFAQEKTKKQLKEEREAAKQKETEALIETREFEFVADRANPQGTRSIDMTTNSNFFRFEKDTIHSSMPFFGRAYSGAGYGGGGGLDFKGVAKDFSVKKGKKSYTIKASVQGSDQNSVSSCDIILEIFFNGTAYLNMSPSNRSQISYSGEVHKLQKK